MTTQPEQPAQEIAPAATPSVIPPVTDNDVAGQIMWQKAQQEYPYLAQQQVPFVYTPKEGKNYLEVWQPGDEGTPSYQRPSQLPQSQVGIQVFNPEGGSPLNILGDYVSHYAINQDPKLKELYSQFSQSVSPERQEKRYAETLKNYVEQMNELKSQGQTIPEDLQEEYQSALADKQGWWQRAGLPEYFRGYPFKQWGEDDEAKKYYENPQQLQILDQVRNYLGIK